MMDEKAPSMMPADIARRLPPSLIVHLAKWQHYGPGDMYRALRDLLESEEELVITEGLAERRDGKLMPSQRLYAVVLSCGRIYEAARPAPSYEDIERYLRSR